MQVHGQPRFQIDQMDFLAKGQLRSLSKAKMAGVPWFFFLNKFRCSAEKSLLLEKDKCSSSF